MRFCFFVILISMFGCGVVKVKTHPEDLVTARKYIEYDSLFASALKQKIYGNYKEAGQLLHECLQIKPKSAAAYYELSLIYSAVNVKSQAVAACLSAVKCDKENEWYWLQLSMNYQDIGKIDSSLYCLKQVTELKPGKYEYAIKLAQLYYENGYYKRSLGKLNNVEKRFGGTIELYITKYKNYLRLVNNKKCIETLITAVKRYPYELRFYGLLAEHYASIGKGKLALNYYKQLVKMDPGNERVYLSLIDFYRNYGNTQEAILVAQKYILNPDFGFSGKSEVLESFLNDEKCFTRFKTNIKGMVDALVFHYPGMSKSYSVLADYLLKDGRLDEVQLLLEKYVKVYKDDDTLFGQLLYALNMRADFKTLYETSVYGMLRYNTNPVMYLYGGIAALRLHKYSEAIEVLNVGLKYTDGSKSLLLKYYMYLGECYNAIKDYSKSDLFFESALSVNPKDVLVLNNYSYYLAIRGEKLEQALLYINRCLDMEPTSYLFLDTYAWVLYRLGSITKAKSAIEMAISNGGDKRPAIVEHYCVIMMAANAKADAVKYYYKLKESGRNVEGMKTILNIKD